MQPRGHGRSLGSGWCRHAWLPCSFFGGSCSCGQSSQVRSNVLPVLCSHTCSCGKHIIPHFKFLITYLSPTQHVPRSSRTPLPALAFPLLTPRTAPCQAHSSAEGFAPCFPEKGEQSGGNSRRFSAPAACAGARAPRLEVLLPSLRSSHLGPNAPLAPWIPAPLTAPWDRSLGILPAHASVRPSIPALPVAPLPLALPPPFCLRCLQTRRGVACLRSLETLFSHSRLACSGQAFVPTAPPRLLLAPDRPSGPFSAHDFLHHHRAAFITAGPSLLFETLPSSLGTQGTTLETLTDLSSQFALWVWASSLPTCVHTQRAELILSPGLSIIAVATARTGAGPAVGRLAARSACSVSGPSLAPRMSHVQK